VNYTIQQNGINLKFIIGEAFTLIYIKNMSSFD